MVKKKERYFVYLPCKPYVKQYLLHNFGSPDEDWPEAISLSQDRFLSKEFKERLIKNSSRYDSKYGEMVRYSVVVPVEVRRDDFYRYGWSLSGSDVVSFCSIVETRVKSMLCTYLDVHKSLGVPIATAIRKFQAKYDFPEDVWPTDSMRREYNRNGNKQPIDLCGDFFDKINHIVMVNLSRNGTISQQGLNVYEKTNI